MAKLWGGRFQKDFTKSVEDFLESIEVDREMVFEDIWGSEAHAIMLAKCGIIQKEDLKKILFWLERARCDFDAGKLVLQKEDEDVHMNVEKYVTNGAGPEYGGKLHTARSRNDQVLVDAKLHIRTRIIGLKRRVFELQRVFLRIAAENLETPVPGYTHTQDAQPITLAYWATAYVSMLMRDVERLDHAYLNVDTNPLGSCALAGTSFPTDRMMTTRLLGFADVHKHSLDAISSRDFIAETMCALAILMSNLSKLAEELVYWGTYEFHILELDDSYTAGSSIMPQKKNPCVAELVRGRTGRIYGSLMQLLTMMKGIPMGYNRDLQEDKPPLWNALEIMEKTLDVTTGMVDTMKINKERLAHLSGANFTTATELANHLVREHGLTFRQCHHIVGALVGELHRKGKNFMDFDEVHAILKRQGVDVGFDEMRQIFDPQNNIRTYKSLGSTSPKEVDRMVSEFKQQLESNVKKTDSQQRAIKKARKRTEDIITKVLSGSDIKNIKV
jgi:argininosuccinate lyase